MSSWEIKNSSLSKTFETKDWQSSTSFFDFISKLAETCEHHPGVEIKYDSVTVSLKTHEKDSVTEIDKAMAKYIDSYFKANKKRLGRK